MEDWNAVRLDPARPPAAGHVESYFLKLNDPTARRALWLKATLLARPGRPVVSEAWAIAFDRDRGHRAAKRVLPVGDRWTDEVRFSSGGLRADVGPLHLAPGAAHGALSGPRGDLRWGLTWRPRLGPLVPFSSPGFYTGAFPRSKLVSPCADADFSGFYEVDGERFEVDGWRGMQGHNWGRGHAYRYHWGHASGFAERDDAVFEGFTGRVQVGPVRTPPVTLLCLRLRGVAYDWNRPVDWLRSRATTDLRRWAFASRSDIGSIEGEFETSTDDLVGLTYENPTGPVTYCLNSKLARVRLEVRRPGHTPLTLTSAISALEIGTTDPEHNVTMYL